MKKHKTVELRRTKTVRAARLRRDGDEKEKRRLIRQLRALLRPGEFVYVGP